MSITSAVSESSRMFVAAVVAIVVTSCGDASAVGDHVARMVSDAQTRLEASEAGRTVARAIDAAGGLEAWYSAPTSAYTWEYANVGSNTQFKSYLVADNLSRRIYHDLLTVGDYGEPRDIEGRFAWDGDGRLDVAGRDRKPESEVLGRDGLLLLEHAVRLGRPRRGLRVTARRGARR